MASGKLFRQVYAGFLRSVKQNVTILYGSILQQATNTCSKSIDFISNSGLAGIYNFIQVRGSFGINK